jgi:hypothetical protein
VPIFRLPGTRLTSRAVCVRGEAEDLRRDLQRVGEQAQHRDVGE